MSDNENQLNENAQNESQNSQLDLQQTASPKKDLYLDPEGGYTDPEQGRAAELAAMTR